MCSVAVKTVLFKSFCMCFYGMELWKFYTAGAINRLRSCYIRCVKSFFGYTRRYSVTSMLLELHLPTFDTLLWNSRVRLIKINYSHVTIHWYLSCSCYDVILFFYGMSLSSCTIFYISCFMVHYSVCLCVCVLCLWFYAWNKLMLCYAMLCYIHHRHHHLRYDGCKFASAT